MGIDILTLAAARAGKGSGGSASKYKQPEWGDAAGVVEVIDETTHTVDADYPMLNVTLYQPLTVGKEYSVTWNGTEYTCIAKEVVDGDYTFPIIGNASALGGEDTGEPFIVADSPDGCLVAVIDGSPTVTLSVKTVGKVTYPIPAQYLGNTMRVTVAHDKTADKTYREIETAIENGVIVQVFFESLGNLSENGYTVYTLSQFVKGTGIIFYNGSFRQILTIASDGTIDTSMAG